MRTHRNSRYVINAVAVIGLLCAVGASANSLNGQKAGKASSGTVIQKKLASTTAYARDLEALAIAAISEDPAEAESAIEQLRAAGQAGLDAMFRVHKDMIASARDGASQVSFSPDTWMTPAKARLKTALEAIGQQYDVHASCLYWHTDFAAAKAEAQAAGKPILSLRLLGNLDEECSCANSRFFRTALYANENVSNYLRNNYVLHWKSVRPVPKITIDYGDGRVLERTITGNSIHYLLTPDGRIMDALPGLYGPQAFMGELANMKAYSDSILNMSEEQQAETLARLHSDIVRELSNRLSADLQTVAAAQEAEAQETEAQQQEESTSASAVRAAIEAAVATATERPNGDNAAAANNRTIGKRVVEGPLLTAMSITEQDAIANQELAGSIDDATWARIAALHSDQATLDESSVALMREHRPNAVVAGLLTVSKALVEDPMVRMVANFQRSIAEDTVRNEYTFRRQIHEWFALAGPGMNSIDVDSLNERVYAELFLTPSSDPWLGLMPADYSALRADGLSLHQPRAGDSGSSPQPSPSNQE